MEGRHYTGYEAAQTQRRLEGTIRKQKRRCLVDEAAGDDEKLSQDKTRLNVLHQRYREFSRAAELETQYERTEIAGVEEKILRSFGYFVKDFDHSTVDIEALNYAQKAFDKLAAEFPEEIKGLTVRLQEAENGTVGWFDKKTKTIYFNTIVFSDWSVFEKGYNELVKSGHFPFGTTADGCFYHEFGHLVGESRGINFLKLTRETLLDMGYGYGTPPHISVKTIESILPRVLSGYSSGYIGKQFEEVIAECFSEWYTSNNPREFCKKFLRKAGVI